MVRTWSIGASIGGAALAAVLLAGCGSTDDDAAASPSSTASARTSAPAEPSPGATPEDYVPASLDGPAQNVPKPVMPELAKEESLAGAQAFLDYWSDAMWYANQTGDTSYVRAIVSDSCEICNEQFEVIEDVYAQGAWFIGGRERLHLQDGQFARATDGVYKPVALAESEGIELVEDGSVTYEAHPRGGDGDPFPVYLDYRNEQWIYITAANMPGTGSNDG